MPDNEIYALTLGQASSTTLRGETMTFRSANVIRGRKITGWKSIVQDIKNAGAEFMDREVVEDGNLVSSRSPGDLPAFTEACFKGL